MLIECAAAGPVVSVGSGADHGPRLGMRVLLPMLVLFGTVAVARPLRDHTSDHDTRCDPALLRPAPASTAAHVCWTWSAGRRSSSATTRRPPRRRNRSGFHPWLLHLSDNGPPCDPPARSLKLGTSLSVSVCCLPEMAGIDPRLRSGDIIKAYSRHAERVWTLGRTAEVRDRCACSLSRPHHQRPD